MNKSEKLLEKTGGTAGGAGHPAAGIQLDAPLRWKSANSDELKLLQTLQGNILKGHGRDQTWNIFFQFGGNVAASKTILRELGKKFITDAHSQLVAAEEHKRKNMDAGTFCAAVLSASGYQALGFKFIVDKENQAFLDGMKHTDSIDALNDPGVHQWQEPFQNVLHGMILVGDDNRGRGSAVVMSLRELLLNNGATIHHIQEGKALRNAVGNGLEHFGYVDGRSQPLMLMEDIERENDGTRRRWNPAFPLKTALVPDLLAKDPLAFGSFFIFRKLEQRVADFKSKEQRLASKMGLTGEDRERAGALVVGRFEDGTPVTLLADAAGEATVSNDFNYDDDMHGARCPFHAHIRKTNPRNSGGFETSEGERLHIMARRGITYEDRTRVIHPDGLPSAESMEEFNERVLPFLPVDGVGLLFMAYNARLSQQFIFTQQTWANSVSFPKGDPASKLSVGIDGVIGQRPEPEPDLPHPGQSYFRKWNDPKSEVVRFDMQGSVMMQGGEYFYAPSLTFLRNL